MGYNGYPEMAARPTFGTLSEYQAETESFSTYVDRVKIFFAANDVAEDKQLPVFLSVIGAKNFALLCNLMSPEKPQTKTIAQVIEVLEKHFEPKPLVTAERFHFHRRNQLSTESVAEYVAELRRLSTHCDFGDHLNDALRDRLVCGLRSENMQRRLLSMKDLTLKDALETAQAMEAADKNARTLQGSESAAVNQFTKSQSRGGNFRKPTASQRPPASQKPPSSQPCYRCGKTNHTPSTCRFLDSHCHHCGKKGHIRSVCRSKKQDLPPHNQSRSVSQKTHYLDTEASSTPPPEEELHLFAIGAPTTKSSPIKCSVVAEGITLDMEVDTGAEVSVISEQTCKRFFPQLSLCKSRVVLKTYTGETMPVVGELHVQVRYGMQSSRLRLVVVGGSGPTLLGRDWLKSLKLDWHQICLVSREKTTELQPLLERYHNVFKDELGTASIHKAKLHVRSDAVPKFFKPRSVPFSTKDAIGAELDRLEAEGILEKVSHSEWAAPIVAVPKKDGTFRICGDYKVTVNQDLDVDQYPLPKPEELFTSLAGGQHFSKLDLSQAYQQLLLDEDSKRYTTINTHKGLYQYTRLPFGVASAPALFQKTMDTILQGIPHVICYLDDILVTGADHTEHLHNLAEVMSRLEHHGLRLKRSKCVFLQSSVDYLGYHVDAQGLHTLPTKVEAIAQAPEPQNVPQLRSFLGLLNYYGKFVPNLATIVHPLNALLRQDVKWHWDAKCSKAFTEAKRVLTSSDVLVHYDPNLPITLAGDASAYGVGAVISHTFPDGSERPIAFASRTLSSSERNYAQLEKEALSLVFGVKKFHQYLYGRRFTLVTDHKPLTAILGPKKGIPPLAAARLQRWAVLLSAYKYDIAFKPTLAHANADGLSRLPLPTDTMEGQSPDASIFNVSQIETLPVTATQIQQATRTDPCLSKVLQYTRHGWPSNVPQCMKPYLNRQAELTVEGDCVLWGIRVIIPMKLRGRILDELHQNHPGMSRMKRLSHSFVWWPGLDQSIEEVVKSCTACQSVRDLPAVAPLHPWIWPTKPWQRIHVDFAGPFQGKMYFIIVDAHSKWPEVFAMGSTSTSSTIAVLRHVFAQAGLPHQLVSDNGPQFVATEFQQFMQANGIKHTRCAPYHPSSNGLAERFVKTFKRAMLAAEHQGVSPEHRLHNFLLSYRSTPHATTNRTPSALFLQRELRTRLDLVKPSCADQVFQQQSHQSHHHDQHAKSREFEVGQAVMARNFRPGKKWLPGVIEKRTGPLSYQVRLQAGDCWNRHIDHLRPGEVKEVSEHDERAQPDDFPFAPISTSTLDPPVQPPQPADVPESSEQTSESCLPQPRYPVRSRHPPDRYAPDHYGL